MNSAFDNIERVLNLIFQDKENSFLFVTLLHYNLSLIIFLQIFLFPSNNYYFKFGVVCWTLMMLSNILCNGSFFIRLEKHILRDKSWDGIYEIFPYLNIPKTKKNITKIFHYTALVTYYTILSKIYLTR